MNTVNFGNYNSYLDFNLFLNSKEIEAPTIKNKSIELEAGDGELDYTEYFGGVKYNNRKLSFEFSTKEPQNNFLKIFSNLQNLLHGKKMKIVLDDDTDFYYYGRVSLNKYKSNGRIGKIAIEVDCEPYKYKKSVTLLSDILSVQKSILCANLRKAVVPKIIVSGACSIVFGNYTLVVDEASTIKDDNIVFVEGQNVIKVTPTSGSINVTIEYQERGL